MGNDRLGSFVWPKPEELRQIASQRTLTSDELLALKSRSFYFPIQLLELARGRDEVNKRTIVTALYNILREQDTIEDANPQVLTPNAKVTLLDHFNRIMNTLVRRSPSEPIGDILEDLSAFTNILVQGVMDGDEKIFVEHFGEGRVLEDVRAYATQNVKEAIGFCDSSMTMGMKAFLKSGKIATKDKLIEYCGYVAGDVGIALNRIVNHVDGVKLSDASARAFGLSLQLTNVIKNINEDWVRRGVLYIPEEFYAGIDNETLFKPDS
ncbi:MAG TPA: squalene/phytoene synthase family protein, partial [Candidatus Nanoarchaeia archaeon]|nr:squalene/phytoene synthase family protein [Candidatus Nanoarchaeia archaeon]